MALARKIFRRICTEIYPNIAGCWQSEDPVSVFVQESRTQVGFCHFVPKLWANLMYRQSTYSQRADIPSFVRLSHVVGIYMSSSRRFWLLDVLNDAQLPVARFSSSVLMIHALQALTLVDKRVCYLVRHLLRIRNHLESANVQLPVASFPWFLRLYAHLSSFT